MRHTPTFIALTVLIVAGCRSQEPTMPTTGEYAFGMGEYDRAFQTVLEKWDPPGAALAVAKHGQVVLARGYGYADLDRGELVQPDSLFRIGSVSKPITAAAILKLAEEGRLDLDAPAFPLLNDLHPPEGADIDPRIYQITVRQLLHHSGGWDREASFDAGFLTIGVMEYMEVIEPPGCPEVIDFALGQPLDFDPGAKHAYSNFGYCVLGRVIEAASGEPYEDYVKREVLEPAGISSMRLGRSRESQRSPGEVTYYDYDSAELARSVFPEMSALVPMPYGGFYLEAMDSSAGWIGSAIDLVRFASALDHEGSGPLLGPQTIDMMVQRPEPELFEGMDQHYGLGWNVQPQGDGEVWWHTGSVPGAYAILYRGSDGLVWAALFNVSIEKPEDEFVLDVMTALGWGQLVDAVWWMCPVSVLLVLSAAVIIIFALRRRRRFGST